MRRLLLINPNTTVAVTDLMVERMAPLLPPDVTLVARTAAFGAPYIACEASHAVAAHAVLQAWAREAAAPGAVPPDGVLIGCFGDPGLLALRESSAAPVTGLAEASFIEAAAHGAFAIVTGGHRWKPMLQRLAQSLGFGDTLLHIETVVPTGAQLRADPVLARVHLGQACERAARSGARTIIVGGAGLAGMTPQLQPFSPVPLIDSVEAGCRVLLGGRAPASQLDDPERPKTVYGFTAMVHSGAATHPVPG